jgi:hypothetical protein
MNLRGVGVLAYRDKGSIVWNTEYRNTIYGKNWLQFKQMSLQILVLGETLEAKLMIF